MILEDLVSTGAVLAPWPVAISERVLPGQRIPVSPLCERKCGSVPTCHALVAKEGENLCPHGLSFHVRHIGEQRVTVFGVRGDLSKGAGTKFLKDALKGRTVSDEEIRSWVRAVSALLDRIAADFLKRQAEMLEPLHDPMRLVRQILHLCTGITLAATKEQDLEEALTRASPDMKSLVRAAEFLNESFDMLTIYFNPEAASFPKKHRFSLYGMIKKLVGMFTISDEVLGIQKLPPIHLNGGSFRSVQLRENFKLIPFALITNATKYSLEGSIRVTILDKTGVTEVSVESVGPPIEADEIPRIYDKKFRGRWAKKHSSGSGVGLYLADAVARANGITLNASSTLTLRKSGDTPLAVNRFWFDVPSR